MLQIIFNRIINNPLDVLALLFGLAYIFLSIRQNIWCWLTGLISSALLAYVFFENKIYADMGLQFYYVIISIYGWYHWLHGGNTKQNNNLKVARLDLKLGIILFIINAILFYIIAFVLVNFTDSEISYWDAFTTAASIIATWMLTRKILEHWLLWIVIDAVSVGLYFYKEAYEALILLAVYTVLAIFGYLKWKKELRIA